MITSLPLVRTLVIASLLGSFAPVATLRAAEPTKMTPTTVTVDFSPPVQVKLQRYGKEEGAGLRARIETAVVKACDRARAPEGSTVTVTVTVEDIAPTHPSREQLAADPSLDPVRTRSLGGADLVGVLRDSGGQVIATVKHHHYPPTLQWRSPSLEPWADATIAIEQFASQMAKACTRAPAG